MTNGDQATLIRRAEHANDFDLDDDDDDSDDWLLRELTYY